MIQAIGIFGLASDEFNQKIINLRRKIHEAGWDVDEPQIETLPHLTLCINKEFEGDVEIIKDYLKDLSERLKPIHLPVAEVKKTEDGNLAVFFDNFFTRNLAKMMTKELEGTGMKPVETEYIKLIRAVVKEANREEVVAELEQLVPERLTIERLAVAGGVISQKDILTEFKLGEKELTGYLPNLKDNHTQNK